jgi:glycosyltransferase involved in cell wall biosynthesis
MTARSAPMVALLPWGDLFDEDFLDGLGVSLDAFRDEFIGSFLFGYIDALRVAGVRTALFCVSRRVASPVRFTHVPTGATVCMLPASGGYRVVRRRMLDPYASTVQEAFGSAHGARRALFAALKEVAPYLATPLRLLARELRREGCVAMVCQQYESARFDACVLLGRLMHLPVFATYQGGGDRQLGGIERSLRPFTLRACAGLIVAARAEAKRVRLRYGVPPEKLARIFNPVDLASWHPMDRDQARAALRMPTDARVVVWHGRVDLAQKGLDILVEAWERVCRERAERDLRLLLVGTGPDADELHRRIAAARLPGVLWVDEFVHDRAALRRYLAAADIYALPSRAEGFPVAPIEAMACGLPVVAADAEGVADILEDGEASGGLLVPCRDPAALAQALGRVLDDEAWGRELAQRARRRAEACFSLEAVGEQLRAFLLGGAGLETRVSPGLDADSAADLGPAQPPLVLRGISPMRIRAGTGFNVQLDGQSALSITAEHADRGTLLAMGRKLLVTTYGSPSYLTALVPRKMLKVPCSYPVYLTDGLRESNRAEFVVEP